MIERWVSVDALVAGSGLGWLTRTAAKAMRERTWEAGVSPLRGGETAKFGERYEGRWTTYQLLRVLLAEVESVTVEEVGEIGVGAEFTEFTLRCQDRTEVHQVKRQIRSANA